MKFFTDIIQAISSAVNQIKKQCPSKIDAARPIHTPSAPDALHDELRMRMEEFIENDLFSLVMQPAMNFRTNTLCTGEILSRLNHPEHGIISPDAFLPIVDSLGLQPKFDRYIFRKSCAWISRALAAGESFDCISINFSRTTLSDVNLSQDLIKIADRYGLPHSTLGIEITEQIPETDVNDLLDTLNQLKAAGFRIILDDFGSGVTSFKDLMRYPLDIVKIDRSLLLQAGTEQGAAAFRGLVATATDLGAEVVCEGIETEAHNRFARAAGCHYGQGYLYFKPTPQDQVFELIRKSTIHEENV